MSRGKKVSAVAETVRGAEFKSPHRKTSSRDRKSTAGTRARVDLFSQTVCAYIEVCNNIMYTTRYVKQSLVLYTAFMVYRIPRLGYTYTQAAQLYGTDGKMIPYHISMLICLQNYYYYILFYGVCVKLSREKKKFLIYYHKLPFFITTMS